MENDPRLCINYLFKDHQGTPLPGRVSVQCATWDDFVSTLASLHDDPLVSDIQTTTLVLPSEILDWAARHLLQQSVVTIAGQSYSCQSLVTWLRSAVDMYALFDRRGWSDDRVDSRVGRADRAALDFALMLHRHPGSSGDEPTGADVPVVADVIARHSAAVRIVGRLLDDATRESGGRDAAPIELLRDAIVLELHEANLLKDG